MEKTKSSDDLELGELPGLEPKVAYLLGGSTKSLGKESSKTLSPKPPVGELQKWVVWKACTHETPSWCRELTLVAKVANYEQLAQEVWASFQLPRWASEVHHVENYHQAPPAPPCLQ